MAVDSNAVGFIGLGVMGEPMCRNLALKSGQTVYGYDRQPEPLKRLADHGVVTASGLEELAKRCHTILLSLPSGDHVSGVCEGPDGLLALMGQGQTLVDTSTSPVDLTRRLAEAFGERGVRYADAPIARTRQAAEEGTLAITVGSDDETFAAIRPLLACCGSDITHCGPVGSGQVVKLLNNMVVIETVTAFSEAAAIAERVGVSPDLLFDAFSKGSADSFALRNHGMKAVLPKVFPERAFSTRYARKDISYALALAADAGIEAGGARHSDALLGRAIEAGDGDLYWPVISRIISGEKG